MLALLCIGSAHAQQGRELWNKPQKPFHIYGNTYYVGTRGLSSILVASPDGLILIDGTVPEAAKQIVKNIRALGYQIEDVKLILNSHVHFDHAGGIAEIQRLSGATVAASAPSAKVLQSGVVDRDDPQFGKLPAIKPSLNVKVFQDRETLKVGSLSITAHLTPGHTPGGTSWTWKSCEQDRCLDMVYADSLNPISADGYLYADPKRKPNGAQQLENSFDVVRALPCDILLTPHPELVDVFGKLEQRGQDIGRDAFIDSSACRAYVQASREKLDQRLAEEHAK
jgi:metallo-beta-lactamase class B